jgi:hypothetical protein
MGDELLEPAGFGDLEDPTAFLDGTDDAFLIALTGVGVEAFGDFMD